MHIPDGYLSPSTCAALYAGATPFWHAAFKRTGRMLGGRMAPVLSLCAAFSFVIMMFNIPLPGGTTGHAMGVCVTTVVLGPWGSMLAVSSALLIQAVFFGDGGITTFGANCFNMAIAGSLTAWMVYRGISGRSAPSSPRRVVAAALGGYLAINTAALLTAIEFGIQPLLFHDPAGAPLYAPYPLRIAVPVMMLGHLTFAGLAEMIVSAGLVLWLQRSRIELLQFTGDGGWQLTRPFWIGVAVLMIATPLGLLAAGTAWGEWSAKDFQKTAMRSEMAAASRNMEPPQSAPAGLKKLSSVWTAPMSDYAPSFFKSLQLGYILSAMMGTGLVILLFLIVDWIAGWVSRRKSAADE